MLSVSPGIQSTLGNETTIDEVLIMDVAEEAASAGCPEQDFWDAELTSGVEREGHDSVGDDAGDRRGIIIQLGDETAEGGEEVLRCGVGEDWGVMRGFIIINREAVGDGLVAEVGKALDGLRAL
ncbi:hypothetical protein M5K25_020532 [Dendrobium thyrsiflorum]|uniref:Uncharacterized protein n=1 Tax=Dendrobium thyrsiflorum TaxID=117978 RepID=A0ABD0UAV1_DENTH